MFHLLRTDKNSVVSRKQKDKAPEAGFHVVLLAVVLRPSLEVGEDNGMKVFFYKYLTFQLVIWVYLLPVSFAWTTCSLNVPVQ